MTRQTLRVLAPSFDELASADDAAFTTPALGRSLRALVWERLDAALGGDWFDGVWSDFVYPTERALQRCQPLAALTDHHIFEARRLPAHDA